MKGRALSCTSTCVASLGKAASPWRTESCRSAGHGQPGNAGILVAGQLGQAPFFFFQAILGEDKNKARHGPGTGQSAG